MLKKLCNEVNNLFGQYFSLTTGTNNFTGTSGNDTFDAGQSTGNINTLNSGDVLAGGAGTDELTAVINASITPSSITGIETISLTAIAAVTADMSNVSGATTINNQGSTFALTLTGLGVATSVNLQDTSTVGQVFTFSSVTGTADAVTIGLKNVSTTASASVLGIETLTLNSTGSGTNTLATLTTDTATRLIVTGTRGLTITNDTIAPLAFVDASANTALDNIGVDIDMAVGAVTVIGGVGNDSFEFNVAGAVSAVGGAGNDFFDFTATFGISDTVDGGVGTADAIRVDHDDAVAITTAMTSTTGGTVTGVERLRLNGFTDDATARAVTLANISSELTTVQIDSITQATDNSLTINYGAGAGALRINVAAAITAGDTLILDAAGTATTDSLAISNVLTTGDSGSTTSNITITDFETVSIATGSYTGTATAQNVGVLSAGSTTAITVTGSNDLVLAAGLVATSINASGLSGSAILSMGAATTITAITGGANNDVLVGDTSSSIDGGAGDDTITGGSGNDTLIGGAGADTITNSGGAADSISAGAGNDTVTATLTAGNTIAGGDGTDILSLAVAATAATAAGVSGFETFQDTAGVTQNMSLFTDNSTFTTVRANSTAGTTAISGASNSLANLTLVTTSTVSFDRLVDGTANFLAVTGVGGQTLTALTIPSEETLTFSSSNTGIATITDMAAAQLTTLNLTGSGNTIFTNAPTLITSLATVNASALTAAATLDASASVTNMTATAGTGVFTFTGGSGADSVTGGVAADSLTGGSGNDTIVGGDSADTLVGGTGIDSLTGGAGADQFRFAESIASGTPGATRYDVVTDWTDGTDFIGISTANTFAAAGNAGLSAIDGIAGAAVARAAGAVAITTGAVNAGTITSTALTQMLKLTTAVATGDTEQAMFNSAIGTGTFTCTTASELLVTIFNASTKQMLLLAVNSGGNTTIGTGDVVTLIGAVNMTATDYTNFTAADILFF